MKPEVKNRILGMVAAGAVIISSSSGLTSCFSINNLPDTEKPYRYVLRDYESFDVDTSVSDSYVCDIFGDVNVRLNFNNQKVIVDCEENMEEREQRIIEKVINYYNEIFATINENYGFEMRDYDYVKDAGKTAIFVSNSSLSAARAHGMHVTGTVKLNVGEGVFINTSQILLDLDKIKDYDDLYAYGVVLHEFGHALGLGDVYYSGSDKTVDVVDMTTVMQTENMIDSALYPNDYAILQALYSNEYKKYGDYEEAVKVVKEKIAKYTEGFYKYYSVVMQERFGATDLLKKEELGSEIVWQGESENTKDYIYALKLNENNTCELTIKNKDGSVLARGAGETIFANGMMFVKKISFDKASNYIKRYSDDVGIKLMLAIYINEGGYLLIRDASNSLICQKKLNLEKLR